MDSNPLDIVYSEKFNHSVNFLKIRNTINLIHILDGIFKVDKENIDKIVESNISREVLTKIAINIVYSIKNDKYYNLFNIDDYNEIVDSNIDEVLDNIDIEVLKNRKDIVVNILRKIGGKLLSDVPDTGDIIKKIPNYKYILNRIVISDNIRYILITIDVIMIIILFALVRSYKILLNGVKILILLIGLLIVTNIYIFLVKYDYNNEWYFLRQAFDRYNSLIIKYEIICLILLSLNILCYKKYKK